MDVPPRVFDNLFSLLPSTYLGVELLHPLVILCLTFGGNAKLFSIAAALFTFPPAMYETSNFFTSLPTVVSFLFLFFLLQPPGDPPDVVILNEKSYNAFQIHPKTSINFPKYHTLKHHVKISQGFSIIYIN